ncbi:SecY protein [Candidatus Phytoplasma australiense]|uniref:Protein translocase subunit SecY n=1 Tax=Phytoplasma australiense TaxID=59748 RepID=B1VAC8_PHYAS|nr:SecY protein [Candidatus Phytoplasma australiense]
MKHKLKLILGNPKLIFQILFTFFIIFLFQLGTRISLPFIPSGFSGWKLSGKEIFFIAPQKLFGLGIYPYITASIVVQFLQKFFPFCREWKEQGQIGKHKINFLTRALALLLAFAQTMAFIQKSNSQLESNLKISSFNYFLIPLIAAAGCAILIWFSDLITSRGVGNGTSLLIIASMGGSLIASFQELNINYLSKLRDGFDSELFSQFLLLVLILILFLVLTVIVQITALKVKVNYARNRVSSESGSYIPLKINTAGVMPVILAQYLMMPFTTLADLIGNQTFKSVVDYLTNARIFNFAFGLYILLIIIFSFFSTFMNVNPEEISEHLSKQDAYIAGLRPGEQTTNYLSSVLFKVTVIGVLFMITLVTTPLLMQRFFKLTHMKLGGTSLLIIVSVAIETIQRIMATAQKKEYAKIF